MENYPSFSIVAVSNQHRGQLEALGFAVTELADRTKTGRGAFAFDTRRGEPDLPVRLRADNPRPGKRATYIIQLIGPIKQSWLELLKAQGVELFDYLPSYSFIAAM